MDNCLRRATFLSAVPSIRRAKARYKCDADLETFENEVETALRLDKACTVCGRLSTAQDGRCEEHIGTSLSGDWPTTSDMKTILRMRDI